VSEECDHERILALLGSRWARDRGKGVLDAFLDPHADALLAEMLDAAKDSFDKATIAGVLGDFKGDAGSAALRRATEVTGPGTRDLRCVALLALAKRDGEAASPQLRAALARKDAVVKDYAVIGLAGAGDDSAWDEVFDRLPALLKRAQRALPSEVAMALAYLAQHLDQPRQERLVRFVRRHWLAIREVGWFKRYWPDAGPDGPPIDAVNVPDTAGLRAWARSPLFEPVGAPTVFG